MAHAIEQVVWPASFVAIALARAGVEQEVWPASFDAIAHAGGGVEHVVGVAGNSDAAFAIGLLGMVRLFRKGEVLTVHMRT